MWWKNNGSWWGRKVVIDYVDPSQNWNLDFNWWPILLVHMHNFKVATDVVELSNKSLKGILMKANLVNVEGVHDGNIHMIIRAFPILSSGGASSYLVPLLKLDVVQTLLCFIQHGFHMVHRWLASFELRLKTWQNFIHMDETSIGSIIVEKNWWPCVALWKSIGLCEVAQCCLSPFDKSLEEVPCPKSKTLEAMNLSKSKSSTIF